MYNHIKSKEVLSKLSQDLTNEFATKIKLDKVTMGSIQMDMKLKDLTRLEYLKELSDKWVLSNIMDCILMTPEFIESCQADDVAIDVIIDEESYQKVKLQGGKHSVVNQMH